MVTACCSSLAASSTTWPLNSGSTWPLNLSSTPSPFSLACSSGWLIRTSLLPLHLMTCSHPCHSSYACIFSWSIPDNGNGCNAFSQHLHGAYENGMSYTKYKQTKKANMQGIQVQQATSQSLYRTSSFNLFSTMTPLFDDPDPGIQLGQYRNA